MLVQLTKNSSPPDELPGVYIRTFGCQMNEYDTAKLLKILEKQYRPVETPEEAQLLLVNTCSVREKPEHKLFSLLGEFRRFKERNREVMIGVGGCVAQQEGENIVRRARTVDFVFGTHNLSLVPSLIEQRRTQGEPQVAVNYRDEWEDLPLGFSETNRVSVLVSISRGCNKNCAYCIVPRTRGPEVSRSLDEILREVKIAAHRGVKEVVLLGQTVNSYGRDLSPRVKFTELLEYISEIKGVERIRFTSPHPQEIRQEFVDLCAENSKVCRHVHMPLQSGSDRILKAMNRNYRRAKYVKIISSLKERIPDIGITTDIIVGFPGETEEDFRETLSLMREVEFDNSFSFMFSPRPDTPAASLPGQLPHEVKLARLQELQGLQKEIAEKRLARWVGKQAEILIEGPASGQPEFLCGRTSQNVMVNLTHQTPTLSPGDLVMAQVTEAARFTLRGEVSAMALEAVG